MQRTGRRDTGPELALRARLHKFRLRYRVDVSPLPSLRRRADVVFIRARVAVYVDGCFWHNCPIHGTSPKANADWWRAKLAANRRRDEDTDIQLTNAGWVVVRIWAHEDAEIAAARVAAIVKARRTDTLC
jgi:DNA mismatch endonuclease (patch repair protein)